MTCISTGSCLCGACAYSYTGEPTVRAICHCPPCRKISGGTNTVNFVVPEGSFALIRGSPKRFSTEHEYGMVLSVFFCPDCGNTLWKEASGSGFKGFKRVQAGTLSESSKLNEKIDMEFYAAARATWLVRLPDAAQKEQF
ncbi:GFA family protein [Aspergillus thermomutatus]|uniref:CENP-V/GFA domain-containing protein n=1 Tax=Aspergillus thermomutatus TaxID=41047 RepID=A0A397HWG9_ASPTH|nr:uncharacterized protein CDV56_109392 [Aspergillus thermomutatus]RHZ65534.1 hypothetical protein CDV56_109392 [Aspergillus thermomutatus]